MDCMAACTTPQRSQRKLVATISNESLGGMSAITDVCVSPPPEKRRRLTLLFKARNLKEADTSDDLKMVSLQEQKQKGAEVEAESWESTSTAAPDSEGCTPKTAASGTVTPQSRLFDDDRDASDSELLEEHEEEGEGEEEQALEEVEEEEEEEEQDESDEEEAFSEEQAFRAEGAKLQPAAAAAVASPSSAPSTASSSSCLGERPELAVLRICARARDLVRGARVAGNKTLSEEAVLRAQVLACYFVQVNASSSLSPLSLEDGDDVAEVAARAACQACRVPGLGGSCADSADEQASEVERSARFGSAPARLPLDFLAGVVEGLVGRLPRSEAFRTQFATRRGEPPHAAARSLASGLLQVARQFVADSFLSAHVALQVEPRAAAAAAVALAATFELRRQGAEVPSEELFAFLAMEAGSAAQLRRATTEIVEVFRLWRNLQKRCDGERKVENSNSGSGLRADAA